MDCQVCGLDCTKVEARILTADTHAFNDFDHPEGVVIKPWAAEYVDGKVQVVLPPCSVVELILE